jgi:GNAT superfamily N-acetyltransferase
MNVRRATAEDAKDIARVQERSWQAAYRHVFPPEELDKGGFIHADRWTERLVRPPTGWSTFVAEAAGEVVGFTSVGPSRDERGIGELYAIYVHPDHWATGTGLALIVQAEEQLRSEYAEVTLWVLEDNPRARQFYERAGWSVDDGRKAEARWGVRAPEVRYRKRFAGV